MSEIRWQSGVPDESGSYLVFDPWGGIHFYDLMLSPTGDAEILATRNGFEAKWSLGRFTDGGTLWIRTRDLDSAARAAP